MSQKIPILFNTEFPMQSVLVIHADPCAGGGAESQLFHNIHSFQSLGYKVTLLHASLSNQQEIYESAVACSVPLEPLIEIKAFPRVINTLSIFNIKSLTLLQYALSLRCASAICRNYEVIHTVLGECFLLHPNVVQHFCIPLFSIKKDNLFYLGFRSNNILKKLLRIAYILVCRILANYDRSVISDHATLSNSHWTADVVSATYPISRASIKPIYFWPDTISSPPFIPFVERQRRILVIGRIVPGKKIDQAIYIRDCLQYLFGVDFQLVVIGRARSMYAKRLVSKYKNSKQILIYPDLDKKHLHEFIMSSLFGLHCYEYEHFGVSACEMRSLGLPTFVHASGGQAEITSPNFTFKNAWEASTKIFQLYSSPELYDSYVHDQLKFGLTHNASHYLENFARQIVGLKS